MSAITTTTSGGSSSLPVLAFQWEEHAGFIHELDSRIQKIDYWQGDYLRISGIYWALTALLLLRPGLDPQSKEFDNQSPLRRSEIIEFVASCQCKEGKKGADIPSILMIIGGFGGNVGHDAHLTFTLSAIQILLMLNSLNLGIAARQQPDGSFQGDKDGEIDTRFSYCAISALKLLDRLKVINVKLAIEFVESCQNYDGGYGATPGGESHAGQVFCCVGMLTILNVKIKEKDRLAEWLALRQLPCGGLNGRPEKLEDVCYSWWVLSSLSMLDCLDWIDRNAIQNFILACQDEVSGGISDRPGDVADIFHTLFGIAGLSILGFEGLAMVEAKYCIPKRLLPSPTLP